MEKNIYEKNGYANRKDYLQSLAEEFDVHVQEVFALSQMLGENEDFDGLIVSLEDDFQ